MHKTLTQLLKLSNAIAPINLEVCRKVIMKSPNLLIKYILLLIASSNSLNSDEIKCCITESLIEHLTKFLIEIDGICFTELYRKKTFQ